MSSIQFQIETQRFGGFMLDLGAGGSGRYKEALSNVSILPKNGGFSDGARTMQNKGKLGKYKSLRRV